MIRDLGAASNADEVTDLQLRLLTMAFHSDCHKNPVALVELSITNAMYIGLRMMDTSKRLAKSL